MSYRTQVAKCCFCTEGNMLSLQWKKACDEEGYTSRSILFSMVSVKSIRAWLIVGCLVAGIVDEISKKEKRERREFLLLEVCCYFPFDLSTGDFFPVCILIRRENGGLKNYGLSTRWNVNVLKPMIYLLVHRSGNIFLLKQTTDLRLIFSTSQFTLEYCLHCKYINLPACNSLYWTYRQDMELVLLRRNE